MFWNRYQYTSSLPPEEFESHLKALLQVERENTLATHLFKLRDVPGDTIQGKLDKQRLTFWRTNYVWNGSFYPVFKLDWEARDTVQVAVRTRLNLLAEGIIVIIGLGFFVWLLDFVLDSGITGAQMLARLGLGAVVFFIFMAIPLYSYHSLRKQSLRGLEEYLRLQ